MGRKSGWQQFADNFNSVYGSFNKVAQDWEMSDIGQQEVEEQFGDDGKSTGFMYGGKLYTNKPTEEEKRLQRITQKMNVMSKYGDHKGALEFGLKHEDLLAQRESNRLNKAIFEELKWQRGIGTSDQMRADKNKTVSESNNIDSQRIRRDELLPGELEQQEADKNKTNADAGNVVSQTNRRDALVPGELEGQRLKNQGLGLDNEGKETKNALDKLTLEQKNALWEIDRPLNEALAQHAKMAANGEFPSEEASANALLDIYGQFKPTEARAMSNKYNSEEITEILQWGQKNSAEIQVILADPKQGLPGVKDWIDHHNGINAGAEIITNDDGSMQLVATDQKTGDVLEVIAEGADETQLRSALLAYSTPGGATKLAAQMFDQQKVQSEIGLNKEKEKTEQSKQKYYNAQAKAEDNKSSKQDEAYKKAKADYMRSDAYLAATHNKTAAEKLQVQGEWEEWYWSKGPGSVSTGLGGGNNGLPEGVTVKLKK